MDLSELIMNIQQLAPQLASTCCVINGAFMTLEDVEKMGYDEFLYRSKINMLILKNLQRTLLNFIKIF